MEPLLAKDLYQYLLELSELMKATGQNGLAQEIYIASRFASGSASELFGEARIVLNKVLVGANLSDQDRNRLRDVLNGIDREFDQISKA